MAYIGRQLARGENKLFDDISSSFNGSTTTFTLAVSSVATATATAYQLFVSLGGVMQKPNTDFTTAGNQITFTTAPAAGLSCWIMMQGDTIDQAAIPDASVTPSKIAGSGDFAFPADVRLKDGDGSHYVGFQAPTTVSTNKIWTLPATDGSANQYLKTNGSGVLSWGSDSNAPEGTAVLSTGESSTNKYLRTDGDGTCSWQTIDTSTYMLLTGGTFTGDVTFDGATAGRDIVFDRSDNALEFADNAKAIFGTGGDLEIFHSASNSIINDVGTGNLLLQLGGSTRAHISTAGLAVTGELTVSTNATITGNLTVSGTTTTINTQTLEVEDKNVVIGKVSSPSDTTADGGGWTLKGATDKTFNWVDSTDAWTSSEHIHVLDGKKLIAGTGSDIEIYHSSGTSYIDNSGGHLFIQNGGTNDNANIYIRAKDGEDSIVCQDDGQVEIFHDNSKVFETETQGIQVLAPDGYSAFLRLYADRGDDNADKYWLKTEQDGTGFYLQNNVSGSTETNLRAVGNGAVDLYHNNSKKLETTSGGINVTGAIQVNGAALSSAPTITATADGAIAANKPVILNTNGSVSTISGSIDATGSRVSAHSDTTLQSRVVFDPDTGKSVFFWCENGNGNTMQYKVATSNSSNVISFGTERTAVPGSVASIDAVYSTVHNKFIIAFRGTNTNLYFKAGSMDSGNDSITWGSEVQAPAQGSIVDFQFRLACDDDNGTAMCHYKKSGTDNYIVGMVTNSSDNSLTVGSTYVDYGANLQADAADLVYDTNNNKYVLLWESSSALKVSYATVNSSNGNAGGEGGVTNLTSYHTFDAQLQYDPTNQVFVAAWGSNSDNRVKARAFTFNGSAFTSGTEIASAYTGEVHERTASDVDMYYNPDANDFGFGYRENGNGYKFRLVRFQVSSGTTLIVSAADQEVGSDGYVALLKMAYDTTLDKVICSFDDGNGARGMVFSPASTNLTNKMFIGFSTAAYSDTDTATIAITGNTTTQSSLTVGTTYYVQRDGTIATTAATPSVLAGKAISTTKLLIRDVTS